jgi:hypothetical protein
MVWKTSTCISINPFWNLYLLEIKLVAYVQKGATWQCATTLKMDGRRPLDVVCEWKIMDFGNMFPPTWYENL